jgi:hypothetical protein
MQVSREEEVKRIEHNVRLLSVTFEVLKSLINERKTWSGGQEVSDLANLHFAAKYVYERWEKEKASLQPKKNFILHTPLHSTIMGTREHSVESTMLYLELMAKTTGSSQ